MSDKTISLTNAELELTQKLQMHFPRGILSPEELALWNGYPKEVITARQAEMLKGIMARPPVGRFFMTVRLGVYKSTAELKQAILASGKKISDYANQILYKIQISLEEIELDLYEVSVAELGFTSATSRKDIYSRAFGYGFKECPGEGGGLSRIQCDDKKWRLIGMNPITADADGDPSVFHLDSDSDALWLFAHYDNPDRLWNPDDVWVFVWPRRK